MTSYPSKSYPPKKRRLWPLIVGAVGVVVALVCLAGVISFAKGTRPPKSQFIPLVVPSTITPAPKLRNTIAEGSWTTGQDFPAGTYEATTANENCYWAIYKVGASVGSAEGVINNHIGGGHLTVTLTTGQGFESEGCGSWSKTG